MELKQKLRDSDRLPRAIAAAVLGIVALRSFRKGKRLRGLVAGAGAVGLGASTSPGGVTDAIDTDELAETVESEVSSVIGGEEPESGQLTCAACGEPIVAGQIRRPNDEGETVHGACLEATA